MVEVEVLGISSKSGSSGGSGRGGKMVVVVPSEEVLDISGDDAGSVSSNLR